MHIIGQCCKAESLNNPHRVIHNIKDRLKINVSLFHVVKNPHKLLQPRWFTSQQETHRLKEIWKVVIPRSHRKSLSYDKTESHCSHPSFPFLLPNVIVSNSLFPVQHCIYFLTYYPTVTCFFALFLKLEYIANCDFSV